MPPHDGSAPVELFDFSFEELRPTQESHNDPLGTPLLECFHWNDLLKQQQDQDVVFATKYYVVAFRSIRSDKANDEQLYAADAAAYMEAKSSGGLLKYWYGTLNERRECLAMCIWDSRESARRALGKPAHAHAVSLASVMYDSYIFERYYLDISETGCSLRLIGKTRS